MIENTNVLTGSKARKKILEGVKLCYDTAKLTLGPEGKNAILPRTFNRGPRITNDGITILELAKQHKDEHIRLSAEAFMEGSKKTNMLAGDGTTGTCVLGGHLYNTVHEKLSDSDIPILININKTGIKGVRALRQEMREAKDIVIAEIKKKAKKVETLDELKRIAIISIGKEDEKIAETIAELMWKLGRDTDGNFVDNHVDIVEGYKGIIETEFSEGMKFPAKVAHHAFVNKPEKFEMVIEDTPVLITNHKIDNPVHIAGIIDKCKVTKLAIFAPEFSAQAIKFLADLYKANIFCYPIKIAALRTEQLEDLSVYTGAKVINKELGLKLESVVLADLGKAEKIIVKEVENKEDAVLIGGKGDITKINERKEILKSQLKESRNDVTRIVLEKRIANLSSAIGIVRVGASTDAESLYLKLKIEDGVNACKGALEEGYVKGGGLCLKEIAEELPESVLTESLKAPYEQIQKNAGGYLPISEDVIDPVKVVRLIVEHAVSVVSSLITCDISIPAANEKTEYDGFEMLSKVIAKWVYFDAKHTGMLHEANAESDRDMQDAFEEAILTDRD